MCGACKVAQLTLRIMATRGRSTERQRDRESRPNPLKDQGDSRKAPSPANFGRVPGDFHSVVEQASFSIAFRSDFGGLGKQKWMPKYNFFNMFFDVSLHRVSTSIFTYLLKAPNQKNSNFP